MAIEILISIVVIFPILLIISRSIRKNAAPMASGAWPVMGHLPKIATKSGVPHRTLGAMADQHGPIFTIKLGLKPALVLSNWKVVKECFINHDLAISNRPKTRTVQNIGYDHAVFVFAPYDSYWREVRRFCHLHFLSTRQVELSRDLREAEVRTSIEELYKFCSDSKSCKGNQVVVDLKKWLAEVTVNIMLRLIVSKRILSSVAKGDDEAGETEGLEKILEELFHYLGSFTIADAIPFLGWLDLDGADKGTKATAKKWDDVISTWLEEHKKKRSASCKTQVENKDFMDSLISYFDGKQGLEGFDADTVIKSTILVMIAGSVETTSVVLTWCLCLLLNNPHELKKAQQELDTHVGRDRCVNESDINNLSYIQAIVKETLRLYPPIPLSLPREFTEDCIVSGYHIPKGTRLIPNVWKIQRDPEVWPEPLEFKPERFLTTHSGIDVKGKHFELIPFGSGRRVCPGRELSNQIVMLILATFLHSFDISKLTSDPVDMTEKFGLTNVKAKPLDVIISARLPSNLY